MINGGESYSISHYWPFNKPKMFNISAINWDKSKVGKRKIKIWTISSGGKNDLVFSSHITRVMTFDEYRDTAARKFLGFWPDVGRLEEFESKLRS